MDRKCTWCDQRMSRVLIVAGVAGAAGCATGPDTCDVATCPAPTGECKVAVCLAIGTCGEANVDDGTAAATQIAGDCKKSVCAGGIVIAHNDDADAENDNQTCTVDSCDAGTVHHAPSAKGTVCTQNNGSVCDGAGNCVACNIDTDCAGAAPKTVCDPTHTCVLPHCSNGKKDFTETDQDCGGVDCGGCGDGLLCVAASDCESNHCVDAACVAGTCDDGILNNMQLGETDADCGGALCGKCSHDRTCKVNTDCNGGDCTAGKCVANCNDAEKDQDESAVDCGGGCPSCGNGESCSVKADCQSNFCFGTTCAACAADGNCAGYEFCKSGVCVNDLAIGLVCTVDAQCLTIHCVDGFCCDSAACGICQSCGMAGSEGTCSNLTANTDPDNECAGVTSCNGAGGCTKLPQGTPCTLPGECATGDCIDGFCCDGECAAICAACNVAGLLGTCSNVPLGQEDSFPANACVGISSCDGTGGCKKDSGQSCAADAECVDGHCVDGFCCGSACGGICQSCSASKTGGADGTCGDVTANTDPDSECVGITNCNGAGGCTKLPQGNPCTQASECATGSCVDGVCCGAGSCASCQSCAVAGSEGVCANLPTSTQDANAAPACVGSFTCNGAGTCIGPNCTELPVTCGPANNESCCASAVVTGGTFNRSNDPAYPATVSDFRLDRFEITVGRFRAFVQAYPGSKPPDGAGAHPLIPGSGWNAAWNGSLPANQANLKAAVKCDATFQTWTDMAAGNENLPMNCLVWFEAFAFCAWDGGRLPTEAEWNYATAGGNEQREYPWSSPPSSMTINPTYAAYDCTGDGSAAGSCAFADVRKVGSKSPVGDGKWGQADLSGGVWEWSLDWNGPYPIPCVDCAILGGSNRVIRGGSWYSIPSALLSSYRSYTSPTYRISHGGARCARTP